MENEDNKKFLIVQLIIIFICIILIIAGCIFIYKIDKKRYKEAMSINSMKYDEDWFEEDLEYYNMSTGVVVKDIIYEEEYRYIEYIILDRKGQYIAEYKLKHCWFGSYKWEFKRYIQYTPIEQEK